MLWISFGRWNHKAGRFLLWERIYFKNWRWTPFVWLSKRYDS